MNNLTDKTQFLTGYQIPPGYNVLFNISDYGTAGHIVIGATLLVNNKIKNYHARIDVAGLTGDFAEISMDFSDCQLLNIFAASAGDTDNDVNILFKAFINKQQGHSPNLIVGCLGSAYLCRNNQFQWPYPQNNPNSCIYGIPHLIYVPVTGFSETWNIPDNWIFRPSVIKCELQTSAVVSNRRITLLIANSTFTIFSETSYQAFVASGTYQLFWALGNLFYNNVYENTYHYNIPEFFLNCDSEIEFSILTPQVGDVLTKFYIYGNYQYNGNLI